MLKLSKVSLISVLFICVLNMGIVSKPMEPLDDYLVIMAHGIGPNYHNNPGDKSDINAAYPADNKHSNVFDDGKDAFGLSFGNLKRYLENEFDLRGRVYNYNFDNPAESFFNDTVGNVSLAHQLGKRGYISRTGDKHLMLENTPYLTDSGYVNYKLDTVNTFGTRVVVTDRCWIEKALWDWKHFVVDSSKSDVLDSIQQIPLSWYPKKVLIIAHSMGGLTSRAYITSDFYKNDITKLITIDSPHEGSPIVASLKNNADYRPEFLGEWAYLALLGSLFNSWLTDYIPGGKATIGYEIFNHTMRFMIVPFNTFLSKFFAGYYGHENGLDQLDPSRPTIPLHLDKKQAFVNDNKPLFRIIATKGTPTLDRKKTEDIIWFGKNFFFLPQGVSSQLLLQADSRYYNNYSAFDRLWARFHASGFLGIQATSKQILLDDGDYFVPFKSQLGENVRLFNDGGNTERWTMSTNKIKNDPELPVYGINKFLSGFEVAQSAIVVGFYAAKLIPGLGDGYSSLFVFCNIMQAGLTGVMLAADVLPDIKKSSILLSEAGPHGTSVWMTYGDSSSKYSDAAIFAYPTGANYVTSPYLNYGVSGNRVIDEALWERPFISFADFTDDSGRSYRARNWDSISVAGVKQPKYWDAGRTLRRSIFEDSTLEIAAEELDNYAGVPLRFRNYTDSIASVHYYSVPAINVIPSQLPKKLEFVIDDLNPRLMKNITITLNNSLAAQADTSTARGRIDNFFVKGSLGCRADSCYFGEQGKLFLVFNNPMGEFLEGANSISITMKNRVGFVKSQSFVINNISLLPQFAQYFPYLHSTLSYKSTRNNPLTMAFTSIVMNNDPFAMNVDGRFTKIGLFSDDNKDSIVYAIGNDSTYISQNCIIVTIPDTSHSAKYYRTTWTLTDADRGKLISGKTYSARFFISDRTRPNSSMIAQWFFTYDNSPLVISPDTAMTRRYSLGADGWNNVQFRCLFQDNVATVPYAFFDSTDGVYLKGTTTLIRRLSFSDIPGKNAAEVFNGELVVTWDGKKDDGTPAADGVYTLRVHGCDRARAYKAWGADNGILDIDKKISRNGIISAAQIDSLKSAAFCTAFTDTAGIVLDRTPPVVSNISLSSSYITTNTAFANGLRVSFFSADTYSKILAARISLVKIDAQGNSTGDTLGISTLVSTCQATTDRRVVTFNNHENQDSAIYLLPPDGKYRVVLQTTDEVGNVSVPVVGGVIVVDKTPPSISNQSPVSIIPQGTSTVVSMGFSCSEINDADINQLGLPAINGAGFNAQILGDDGTIIANATITAQTGNSYQASWTGIPSRSTSFRVRLLVNDKYALPNSAQYETPSYRKDGAAPVIVYPVENDSFFESFAITGFAADPKLGLPDFTHYTLSAERLDGITWVTVDSVCQVPAAFQNSKVGSENVSYVPVNTMGELLGVFRFEKLISASDYHNQIFRIKLVASDGADSAVAYKQVKITKPANSSNAMSINFKTNEPCWSLPDCVNSFITPEVQFTHKDTVCRMDLFTNMHAAVCVKDTFLIGYEIFRNGQIDVTRTGSVKLTLIHQQSNTVVYEEKAQTAPSYLYAPLTNDENPPLPGVQIGICDTNTRLLFVNATAGDYKIDILGQGLTYDPMHSVGLFGVYRDTVQIRATDSLSTGTVYLNENYGAHWDVSVPEGTNRVAFSINKNVVGSVMFMILRKAADGTYKTYSDPEFRVMNSNNGIVYGKDNAPIKDLFPIDLAAINRFFAWDGYMHVGNSAMAAPAGMYRMVAEMWGNNGKTYAATVKELKMITPTVSIINPTLVNNVLNIITVANNGGSGNLSTSAQLSFGVTKSCSVSVEIYQSFPTKLIAHLLDTMANPGSKPYSFSWNGAVNGLFADPQKQYYFKVSFKSLDGSGTNEYNSGAITFSSGSTTSSLGAPSLALFTDTTNGSGWIQNYKGENVLFNKGKSDFKVMADATAKYKPAMPVTVGLKYAKIPSANPYPSENFAFGIRRTFDRIKVGYVMIAKYYRRDITDDEDDGELVKWKRTDVATNFLKFTGSILIGKNDSAQVCRKILEPGLNSQTQRNDLLFLDGYRIAFYLLDANGVNQFGESFNYNEIASTEADFNNLRSRGNSIDFFDVNSEDINKGGINYFYAGVHYGGGDPIAKTAYTNNKAVKIEEINEQSNEWNKCSTYKLFRDNDSLGYLTHASINFLSYDRKNSEYEYKPYNEAYSSDKLNLSSKSETVLINGVSKSVLDTHQVALQNPNCGGIQMKYRAYAQYSIITVLSGWRDDGVYEEGFGNIFLEMLFKLNPKMWDPDFGLTNLVNRYHIWSPENEMAYSSSGYIPKDSLDNDNDGVADEGLTTGDGVSETNGYLVPGKPQRISTYYLGDNMGDNESQNMFHLLSFGNAYPSIPKEVNLLAGWSKVFRTSFNPSDEKMQIVNLLPSNNYSKMNLQIKKKSSWYDIIGVIPSPWPMIQYSLRPRVLYPTFGNDTSTNIETLIFGDTGVADGSHFFNEYTGQSKVPYLANTFWELEAYVDSNDVKVHPQKVFSPLAEYTPVGSAYVKEGPGNKSGFRNDDKESWVLSMPTAAETMTVFIKDTLRCGDDGLYLAQFNLDDDAIKAQLSSQGLINFADYYLPVLASAKILPDTTFCNWRTWTNGHTRTSDYYFHEFLATKTMGDPITLCSLNVAQAGTIVTVTPNSGWPVDWRGSLDDYSLQDVNDDQDYYINNDNQDIDRIDEEGDPFDVSGAANIDKDGDNSFREDPSSIYMVPDKNSVRRGINYLEYSTWVDAKKILSFTGISTRSLRVQSGMSLAPGQVSFADAKRPIHSFLQSGENNKNPSLYNLAFDRSRMGIYNIRGDVHPDFYLDNTTSNAVVKAKTFNGAPQKLMKITGVVHGPYAVFATDEKGNFTRIIPDPKLTNDRVYPFQPQFNRQYMDSITSFTLGYWDVTRENGLKSLMVLEYSRVTPTQIARYGFIPKVYVGEYYSPSNNLVLRDPCGNVQVNIPAGALSEEKCFTVTPVTASEVNQVGYIANCGPVVQVSPSVPAFAVQPSIEWKFTKNEIISNRWNPSTFVISKVSEIDGSLKPLSALTISLYSGSSAPTEYHRDNLSQNLNIPSDYDSLKVTAFVNSFSRWAIVQRDSIPSIPITIAPVPSLIYSNKLAISGTRDPNRTVIVKRVSPFPTQWSIPASAQSWDLEILLATGVNNFTVQYDVGSSNNVEFSIVRKVVDVTALPVVVLDTLISPNSDGIKDDLRIALKPLATQTNLNGYLEIQLNKLDGSVFNICQKAVSKDISVVSVDLNRLGVLYGKESLYGTVTFIEDSISRHQSCAIRVTLDYEKPTFSYDAEAHLDNGNCLEVSGTISDNVELQNAQITLLGNSNKQLLKSNISLLGQQSSLNVSLDLYNVLDADLIEGKYVDVQILASDLAGNIASRSFRVIMKENWADWAFSKVVSLDVASGLIDQTNTTENFGFPIRLNESNFNFTDAQTNGNDIRILSSAGTLLPYEIEQWAPASKNAVIWVGLPLAAFNTQNPYPATILWGNSRAVGRENPKRLWGSNNVAVYHFGTRAREEQGLVSKEMKILLNTSSSGANVAGNVENFPVLVRLDNLNFNFAEANSNGSNIQFSDAQGTVLASEIEYWNSSEKKAAIWVKVPVIYGNNSQQTITMRWGADISISSNATDVFNPTMFNGVWHLGDNPTGIAPQIKNSALNAQDGTAQGSMSSTNCVDGLIGKAILFDGVNDFVDMGTGANVDITGATDFTISAWAKMNVRNDWNAIAGKGDHQYHIQFRPYYIHDEFTIYDDRDWQWAANFTQPEVVAGSWYLITGSYNSATKALSLYRNGQYIATASANYISSLRDDPFCIGVNSEYWSRYFNGIIDEVRLEKTVNSPDWVKLCYENQKVNQSLVQIAPKKELRVFLNTTFSGANVTEDIKNFPVLVRLDKWNMDFAAANPNGSDIQFCDAKGNVLASEIDYWNSTEKKASVWVTVPLIYGNNSRQYITMKWGTPVVKPAGQPPVFDKSNSFASVWHLGDDPSGAEPQMRNATDNQFGGIVRGGMTSSNVVDGMIGKAVQLDGVNDYIDCGTRSNVDITGSVDLTISAWVKLNIRNEWNAIAGKGDHQYHIQFRPYYIHDEFCIYDDTDWKPAYTFGMPEIVAGTWYYVTGTYSSNTKTLSLYRNGALIASNKANYISSRKDDPFTIGVNSEYFSRYFNGIIDEVRLNTVACSPAWIKLCYENQREDQSFVQISSIYDATLYSHNAKDYGTVQNGGVLGASRQLVDSSFLSCKNVLVFNGSQQFTFSSWVKRDRSNISEIISAASDDVSGWRLGFDSQGKAFFGNGTANAQSAAPLAGGNEWHFLSCTYDGSYFQIFVDGISVGKTQGTMPALASKIPILIGQWLRGQNLVGSIDEVQISKVCRSPQWINLLWETQKANQNLIRVP